MKLKDKVAIITGGGSGIGMEQAKKFAEEGAKIVAADLNEEGLAEVKKEVEQAGGEISTIKADITDYENVKKVVETALNEFGTIDILCNTAGLLDDRKPILDTSEELWDSIFSINIKAQFLLTKEVLKTMVEKEKGIIINIASIASKVAGGAGIAYTASKHAVEGFTKQLSYDYGQKGIRVNAIGPGHIRTGMTKEQDPEDFVGVPAGRPGKPEEIAELSLFLASEQSDFIHGSTVMIDGGWTVN